MNGSIRRTSVRRFLGALVSGSALFVVAQMHAQDNAVYNSSGTNTVHSKAFIDASILLQNDICTTIHTLIQQQ
jgi:hypothetical protein